MEGNEHKKCRECYADIPYLASKCVKCGSYQDWRVHLPAWGQLVTMVVALSALVTSIVAYTHATLDEFWRASERIGFDLDSALVKVELEQSTFLVTNKMTSSVVVTDMYCRFYLPLDPKTHYFDTLYSDPVKQYRWEDTAGMFLVSFEPTKPTQIDPTGQTIIDFFVSHISPAMQADRLTNPPKPDQLVNSTCMITGVTGQNKVVAGGILLSPADTIDIDALDLLLIADYSTQQQNEFLSLQKKILGSGCIDFRRAT